MGNLETAERWIEIWNGGDFERLLDLVADDFTVVDHAQGSELHGKQGLRAFLDGFRSFASDMAVPEVRYHDAGDTVVIEYLGTGRHTGALGDIAPTNELLSVPMVAIQRYGGDGRIIGHEVYYDQLSMLAPIVSRALPTLTEQELTTTVGAAQPLHVEAGQDVIVQGGEPDRVYIVVSGEANVLRSNGDGEQLVASIGRGQLFGEMGLLSGAPRTATVRARTDLDLLALDREAFRRMVEASEPTSAFIGHLVRERQGAAAVAG